MPWQGKLRRDLNRFSCKFGQLPEGGIDFFKYQQQIYNPMNGSGLIKILAVVIVITGVASTWYLINQTVDVNADVFDVNGDSFRFEDLFSAAGIVEVEGYTGAPLENIISAAGIQEPENQTYVIHSSDGYQQTVEWKDMAGGIITEDRRMVLPSLPKKFWVKDVVKIEVVE
jgi:hypothetical protein